MTYKEALAEFRAATATYRALSLDERGSPDGLALWRKSDLACKQFLRIANALPKVLHAVAHCPR